MKLYETDVSEPAKLFEMSECIPQKKKTLRRTSKTLSNTVQWQESNPVYGKVIPKATKTSAYVTKIRSIKQIY